MRAVIPVAGLGTRLKPHTHSLPKVLLNVGGKPILGHIIENILKEGITEATLILGHLGEMIEDYIHKNYPQLKCDCVVQDEMLGLGHAIYQAPTFNNDKIFIILGDTVFDVELKGLTSLEHSALGVKEVEDPSLFGVAIKNGKFIEKLIEKPDTPVSKLALVGLYYIADSAMLSECLNELMEKDIKTRGEYQLTDALQLMIDKGEKMDTFPVEGWYDCGKPETLLTTNQFLLSKNGTNREIEGVVINHPVYIAGNAVVKNSVIGPNTTIAENCTVADSIIRNSIINQNSSVEKSMLENSIIGSNAKLKGSFQKLNAGDSSEIEFY
jgi:glucose-1-phosphate thymidylyltransferase